MHTILQRDRAFACDIPANFRAAHLATAPERVSVPQSAPTGVTPVDALPFGDRSVIISLGALGLLVIDDDGNHHHLDLPSDMLVAVSGEHCLSVRYFSNRTVVHRVELHARRITPLGSARLPMFSSRAEDGIWFVVEAQQRLVALDISTDSLSNVVWSCSEEGAILGVESRDDTVVSIVSRDRSIYHELRGRDALDDPIATAITSPERHYVLPQHGTFPTDIEAMPALPVLPASTLLTFHDGNTAPPAELSDCHAYASGGTCDALARSTATGVEVSLVRPKDAARLGSVHLEGTKHVRIRATSAGHFVFSDDLGRVLVIDPVTRAVLIRWAVDASLR